MTHAEWTEMWKSVKQIEVLTNKYAFGHVELTTEDHQSLRLAIDRIKKLIQDEIGQME